MFGCQLVCVEQSTTRAQLQMWLRHGRPLFTHLITPHLQPAIQCFTAYSKPGQTHASISIRVYGGRIALAETTLIYYRTSQLRSSSPSPGLASTPPRLSSIPFGEAHTVAHEDPQVDETTHKQPVTSHASIINATVAVFGILF